MSELFKSAMGYFGSTSNGTTDNEFVGQFVEIGDEKFRIKKVIAEGGFAFVYVAQDSKGADYALKRLLAADNEANENIRREIIILKTLNGHPNIIKFISGSFIDRNQTVHGQSEYLVLTELCSGGSLIDVLRNRNTPLDPDVICRIMYQVCRAVSHMHNQTPSIIHRDLKIENLLIGSDGIIKLCDFGSATTDVYRPENSWNISQRNSLEEKLAKFTTPMYRAPEMVDTWENHPITSACDVWALGCILYMLCFMQHPFEDGAKLAILNANYTIPQGDTRYACFHEIIRNCLKTNPHQRLTVAGILERLAAIAETRNYNLKEPLKLEGKPVVSSGGSAQSSPVHTSNNAPQRPAPPRPVPPHPARPAEPPRRPTPPLNTAQPSYPPNVPVRGPTPPAVPQGSPMQQRAGDMQKPTHPSGGIFSSLKGGAGSFLKNLKDTSSKVMQTMQQSIARADLDISYVTSKLIVMPFPSEGLESAYRTNHIEDVKLFLETRHPNAKYSIYNLSGRTYQSRFGQGVRVIDCGFAYTHNSKAPTLNALYQLCEDIYQYLEADEKNVVVVHCLDGKAVSATLVCALMIYSKLFVVPEDAMQMFAVKRSPPNLRASELRYLYYIATIVNQPRGFPHYKPILLVSIMLHPVPLFTKLRDGCRPYVEIYSGDRCILSTLKEYERMRVFNIAEGKVVLPLEATVCGDVSVIVYHARHSLGRPAGIKICHIQFHTGFIQSTQTTIKYDKSELDDLTESHQIEHFGGNFFASMDISMLEAERRPARPAPWEASDARPRNPNILFSSQIEQDECIDNFVSKPASANINVPHREPPPRPTRPAPSSPRPPHLANENIYKDSSDSETEHSKTEEIKKPAVQRKESVDLLNLGSDASQQPASNNNQPVSNFDLLGGFTDMNAFSGFVPDANPAPDLIGSTTTAATKKNDLLFDPFGTTDATKGGDNLIGNWDNFIPPTTNNTAAPNINLNNSTSINNMQQNKAEPPKSKDPFADLGNLGNTLNAPWTGSNQPSPNTAGTSPAHQGYGAFPGPGTSSPHMGPPTTPQHQSAKSPQEAHRPDYSRSHFDSMLGGKADPSKPTGKKSGDVFGDLLGSQGYEFAAKRDNSPKTINDMRKTELARDMDPDKLRIMEWVDGKTNNIRALLCSLHTVIWEDCKWRRCDMHQLVTPADVKKAYRKACLAVHPDKQVGTENEKIAKMVFMELNNAWTNFENDASQQNMFSS